MLGGTDGGRRRRGSGAASVESKAAPKENGGKGKKENDKEKIKQKLLVLPDGHVLHVLLRAAIVAAVEVIDGLVVDALPGVVGMGMDVPAVVDGLPVLAPEAEKAPGEIVRLVDPVTQRLPDVGDMLSDKDDVVPVVASHGKILEKGAEKLPVLGAQILVALVKYKDGLLLGHDLLEKPQKALGVGVVPGAVWADCPVIAPIPGEPVVESHREAVKAPIDLRGRHLEPRGYPHGIQAGDVAEYMALLPKLGKNIV